MNRRGVGRPSQVGEARTEFFTVRLTADEKAAIEQMNINLTELIRGIAKSWKRSQSDLPKAS